MSGRFSERARRRCQLDSQIEAGFDGIGSSQATAMFRVPMEQE